MEIKVLMTITWHDGVPDGGRRKLLLCKDFNIKDSELAKERIREALTEYGAKDIEYDYSFGEEHHFTTSIKNQLFSSFSLYGERYDEHSLKIELSWVIEHHENLLKLDELSSKKTVVDLSR